MTEDNDAPHARIDRHQSQESLRDLCKLVISLASGVLAISAAFVARVASDAGPCLLILVLSWCYLIASILRGVKAIDILADAQQKGTTTWWAMTIEPARQCWRNFRSGVIALIVFCAATSLTTALTGPGMERFLSYWF